MRSPKLGYYSQHAVTSWQELWETPWWTKTRPTTFKLKTRPKMCGMVQKMCSMLPQMCGMVPQMCGMVPKMCGMGPKFCGMVPKIWGMVFKMFNIVPKICSMVPKMCSMVPKCAAWCLKSKILNLKIENQFFLENFQVKFWFLLNGSTNPNGS